MNISEKYKDTITVAGQLLITCVAYGLIPVVVSYVDGGSAPFTFMAAWGLGGAFSCLSYVLIFYRGVFRKIICNFAGVLPSKTPEYNGFPRWNWSVILALPRSLTVAFFAWSTVFLPEIVSAILYESWPIVFVFLLHISFKDRSKLEFRFSIKSIFLIIFVLAGAVLIVLSISQENMVESNYPTPGVMLGVFLLALAIYFSVQTVYFFKYSEVVKKWTGKQLSAEMESREIKDGEGHFMLLRGISQAIGSIVGCILCIIGLTTGSFNTGSFGMQNFFFVVICGALIEVFGSITNAKGTLKMISIPNSQTFRCLTPIFGVLFLLIFTSAVENVDFNLVLFGYFAIYLGSMLVFLETENQNRMAYSVIFLWTFGVFTIYRENKFGTWFKKIAEQFDSNTYFTVLGLLAAAFTILLTLYTTRISTRISEEEKLLLSLKSRLKNIERRYGINMLSRLEEINISKKPSEIKCAYLDICRKLEKIENGKIGNLCERQYLMKTQVELDILVNGKLSYEENGELYAGVIIGLSAITLAFFARPVAEDNSVVFYNLFSLIFSGVIAFLLFYANDLRHKRNTGILEKHEEDINGRIHYRVRFRTDEKIEEWRVLAFVTVATLVIVIIAILAGIDISS